MYVCMYVCMYVRMYVCMHVCVYACMHACMQKLSNSKQCLPPRSPLSWLNNTMYIFLPAVQVANISFRMQVGGITGSIKIRNSLIYCHNEPIAVTLI